MVGPTGPNIPPPRATGHDRRRRRTGGRNQFDKRELRKALNQPPPIWHEQSVPVVRFVQKPQLLRFPSGSGTKAGIGNRPGHRPN